MDKIYFIVSLLVFLSYTIFPSDGDAVQYCFQCNSYHDPDCESIQANDTSSRHYKLCEPQENIPFDSPFFCRKIVQTIYDRDGMKRVIRRCGWIKHRRDCYSMTNKGHEDVVCQCFKDGCNAAPASLAASMFPALLAAATSLLLGAHLRI